MKTYVLTVVNEITLEARAFIIKSKFNFDDCSTDLFETIDDYMAFCDEHDISDDDLHFVNEI